MARVAIVGVGAIGGAIAALLEVTGLHEITLCTRRPLDSLAVETPEGTISVRATNALDPRLADPVDWVLVATKTYDIESASAWLDRLRGKDTPVAVVQNGVEHRKKFEPYVDAKEIVPVIIDCPAERLENGIVRQRGGVFMQVEKGLIGSAFASLFQGSKARVELTDDFLTAAWKKLCLNSAGAISALVMKPVGVLQDKALGQIALDIVSECAAVGRAEGARLADDIGMQVLEGYRAQPPDSINSMLADRIAGRKMEIDSRNGVIVRKGEQHKIDTPTNGMIVALLNAI
jgi:2-dehydropantoate 2-reductase